MRATLRLVGQQVEDEDEPVGIAMGNASNLFAAKSNKPSTPNQMIKDYYGKQAMSSGKAGMGQKNIADAMSRKSTAISASNSEIGTPGSILQKNDKLARRDSYRRKHDPLEDARNSSHVQLSIQKAEEEVMVLNLDPKAGKKRKPSKLKPIEPATNKQGKIAGNFAAEVLAQMDEN